MTLPENVYCVTSSNFDLAVDFILKHYWKHENFSRALRLHDNSEALEELRPFTKMLIKKGHSLCYMVDGTMAAVAVNVIQTSSTSAENFGRYVQQCKHAASASILQFILDLEQYDEHIFKRAAVDCYLEIICIATASEFKRCGYAGGLVQASIELAKRLKNPTPGAVVAKCTLKYAEKITKKLQFQTVLDLGTEIPKWMFKFERNISSEAILKLQVLKL